jgi:hypothetical protein
MGAKTDAAMTNVTAALKARTAVAQRIVAADTQLSKDVAERNDADKRYQAYITSHGWDAQNTPGREEAMAADGGLKQLFAVFAAAMKRVDAGQMALTKLNAEHVTADALLRKRLAELEALVNEKAKSKNPLKKKSVPKAQAFIAAMRGILH